MIVVKLQGGLGNQLFQYAVALAASQQVSKDIIAENSYYQLVHNRDYVLEKLGIRIKTRSTSSYPLLFPLNFIQTQHLTFTLAQKLHFYGLTYLQEEIPFSVDTRLATLTTPSFLLGFWQNHIYIDSVSHILLRDINHHTHLTPVAESTKKTILMTASIGIHVRRTDYVTSNVFTPCSLDYYREAIRYLGSKIKSPRFFVCSDDLPWAKQHLSLPSNTIYLGDLHLPDWQEFLLLSSCRHLIIANSTFSWWAARINDTKNRRVVMPRIWQVGNPEATLALHYPHWKLL